MSACPICMGTDCAQACAAGQCYAEEMQRQMEAENDAQFEDALRQQQAEEWEREEGGR